MRTRTHAYTCKHSHTVELMTVWERGDSGGSKVPGVIMRQ